MTASGSGDVFDVKKIRRLVQLMKDHDLAEVDLEQGEQRIRLRRNAGGEVVYQPPVQAAVPMAAPAVTAEAGKADAPAAVSDDSLTVIKSPIVGTFYSASGPDTEPFVKVGDHVGPESTVCIVEAMKVFNEIPAEVSGKVTAILVANGDPVEFGQPLFKVDISA
ncbi:MAG: acetyl-CoA carboxylase biotin carboxyl carrier protein [Planctomycetota bacterium]|nr:acetyl-CoA carboxylase biotin carboxyl carrier protein [Planctomycetota bacterium]